MKLYIFKGSLRSSCHRSREVIYPLCAQPEVTSLDPAPVPLLLRLLPSRFATTDSAVPIHTKRLALPRNTQVRCGHSALQPAQCYPGAGSAWHPGPLRPQSGSGFRSIRAGLMAVAHDMSRMLGWVGVSQTEMGVKPIFHLGGLVN
jgi:hypothetical protein